MPALRVVTLLAGCAILTAQTPTGAIEGTVTDSSGAVMAGATVTITETATSHALPLTTNAFGRYSARNLLPGLYSVRVDARDFRPGVVDNITVDSGAVVNRDVTLELGSREQIIEVTAESVTVDTSRQTVDSIITGNEIRNLPLYSRNFLDLAALAPGVIVRDGVSTDPTKAFGYRAVGVNGRSGTATRVQIDGVDVTDESVGTTTANISPEAVGEFQLTRSSLDISTSLTSSGAVNIISKSGANDCPRERSPTQRLGLTIRPFSAQSRRTRNPAGPTTAVSRWKWSIATRRATLSRCSTS